MWVVVLISAVSAARAEEPRRVGPGTGDHPLVPGRTEISWPYTRVVDLFALPRGCTLFPPHARRDFRAEIDGSAEIAVPIARVVVPEPAPVDAARNVWLEFGDVPALPHVIECFRAPSAGLLDVVWMRDFDRAIDSSIEQAVPLPRE